MIEILNLISSSTSVTDVWVRAGQSNMLGSTGGVAPLAPYTNPNTNAFIIGTNGGNTATTISSFETLNEDSTLGNRHGAELSIAYNYAIRQPSKDVYFVKVSQGSTSLILDWSGSTYLRTELISKINTAKTYFDNNNINVRWIWSWNQWEQDMSTTRAAAYEDSYQDLISDITGSTSIEFYKHIIFKINPNSDLYNATHGPVVLSAQTANANLYGGEIISGDDLSFHDGIHYASTQYHIIGDREYFAVY